VNLAGWIAMQDKPVESSEPPQDDALGRKPVSPAARRRTTPTVVPAVIGTSLAVGFAVGLWLGIGALFSVLAAPPTEDPLPPWRDFVYGSGTFGMVSILARRGIASIPQSIRQADRSGSSSPVVSVLASIVQWLGKFLWPASGGS
jgi:hypothetical protein